MTTTTITSIIISIIIIAAGNRKYSTNLPHSEQLNKFNRWPINEQTASLHKAPTFVSGGFTSGCTRQDLTKPSTTCLSVEIRRRRRSFGGDATVPDDDAIMSTTNHVFRIFDNSTYAVHTPRYSKTSCSRMDPTM